VSEWLLYLAGFTSIAGDSGGPVILLTLVVPALALTGALALACFVKAFGAAFLGTARTADAAEAREVPARMRLAMAPLVLGCLAIGLLPTLFAPLLARAVQLTAPHIEMPGALANLLRPVQTSALIITTLAVAAVALLLATRRHAATAVTWDCGYAAPTARMQYTSSSLARGLVGVFAWAMPPVVHFWDRRRSSSLALFPTGAGFHSHVPDTVLDRALLPTLRGARWVIGFARYIQHGRMQLYILYLGVTLILLLSWSAR
jgi:hydrogenase-4 component B